MLGSSKNSRFEGQNWSDGANHKYSRTDADVKAEDASEKAPWLEQQDVPTSSTNQAAKERDPFQGSTATLPVDPADIAKRGVDLQAMRNTALVSAKAPEAVTPSNPNP
jgi:hypothetical protein